MSGAQAETGRLLSKDLSRGCTRARPASDQSSCITWRRAGHSGSSAVLKTCQTESSCTEKVRARETLAMLQATRGRQGAASVMGTHRQHQALCARSLQGISPCPKYLVAIPSQRGSALDTAASRSKWARRA
eukprot:1101773-Pleurochrysis_carterae.AAC.2